MTGQLLELLEPEGRTHLRRLEVPAELVEDEHVVVADAVDVFPEVALALARAVELHLGATAPAAQQQAAVAQVLVVEHHHAAVARARDDVRVGEAGEADVGAGAGRSAAQRVTERVARVFDDEQVVAIGDRAHGVPVGGVAD